MSVIEVRNLRKRYRGHVAVDDVSFAVEQGEIFGVLGPNGAGKTTTVECVAGLRVPDGGAVVGASGSTRGGTRPSCGNRSASSSQESRLPDRIKVWEALDLYGSFYRDPGGLDGADGGGGARRQARHRVPASSPAASSSGCSIALALVGDPQVAILDELTTGLDPQARRDTWELIEQIRDRG